MPSILRPIQSLLYRFTLKEEKTENGPKIRGERIHYEFIDQHWLHSDGENPDRLAQENPSRSMDSAHTYIYHHRMGGRAIYTGPTAYTDIRSVRRWKRYINNDDKGHDRWMIRRKGKNQRKNERKDSKKMKISGLENLYDDHSTKEEVGFWKRVESEIKEGAIETS